MQLFLSTGAKSSLVVSLALGAGDCESGVYPLNSAFKLTQMIYQVQLVGLLTRLLVF